MRLATVDNGSPDGKLVLISADGARYLEAPVPNLLAAMEQWSTVEPLLREYSSRVDGGEGYLLDLAAFRAPLPRSWQWLDGSAFATHGGLMQVAFALPPIETDQPLMYQGMSDRFLAPQEPAHFPSEADGIDFEGEFGVIVDFVPMGTTAEQALRHIRLIVQINDWSLRAIAPVEMKTGFGWVQAKPACSMAPFAVSPDALGGNWRDGRVCMDLMINWNGRRFGQANGAAMEFGFHELVAHAARTRNLVAGTVIGSGTVSNSNYAEVGSSCISERRAIEIIESGEPQTPFMGFGDSVEMFGQTAEGERPFGTIEQQIRKN